MLRIDFVAGLVNYCVPDGEARLKALEIARDINHKVKKPIISLLLLTRNYRAKMQIFQSSLSHVSSIIVIDVLEAHYYL